MIEYPVNTGTLRPDTSTISGKIESYLLSSHELARTDLAMTLAEIDVGSLRAGTRDALIASLRPVEITTPFQLKQKHFTTVNSRPVQWTLCSDAEPRLRVAMSEKMTMAITANCVDEALSPTDLLVMKSIGRLVGLCTQSAITPKGAVFVEGVWYAPTDAPVRSAIRRGIIDGQGRMSVEPGSWVVQRACDGPTYLELSSGLNANRPDRYTDAVQGRRKTVSGQINDDYGG